MRTYADCASTLDILKMDSGLLPKPNSSWNVFVPKKGDFAHVDEDGKDYEFDGSEWVIVKEEG